MCSLSLSPAGGDLPAGIERAVPRSAPKPRIPLFSSPLLSLIKYLAASTAPYLPVPRLNHVVPPPPAPTVPRQLPGDPVDGPVDPVPAAAAQESDDPQQDRETRRRERAGRQRHQEGVGPPTQQPFHLPIIISSPLGPGFRGDGPLQQQVQEPGAPGGRVNELYVQEPADADGARP
ncbi:hypothetical protein DL767_008100 [Monosporascus sp. MG133]|nr:hypothetical protein DL767_008100 [Monosporascus sp. MG133]